MSDFLNGNILFSILLSAHLTGDFILQTDRIYALKLVSLKGQLLHASMNFISVFLFVMIAYLNLVPAIISALIVFITHFIIDYIKLKIRERNPFLFLLDQVLHIGIILIIAIFLNSRFTTINLFNNLDKYIFTFNGILIIIFFYQYFFKNVCYFFNIPTEKNKIHETFEFIERFLIFFFAYMHGFFFILIPLILLPRLIIAFKEEKESYLYDILLSMIVSALGGILLRKLTILEPVNPIIFLVLGFSCIVLYILIDKFSNLIIPKYYLKNKK